MRNTLCERATWWYKGLSDSIAGVHVWTKVKRAHSHTHTQTELYLCAECLPVLPTVFSLKALRRQSWIASCACLPTCHRHPVRLMWLHTAFFWQVPWAGDAVRFSSKLDKSSQIKGISAWWKIGPIYTWISVTENSWKFFDGLVRSWTSAGLLSKLWASWVSYLEGPALFFSYCFVKFQQPFFYRFDVLAQEHNIYKVETASWQGWIIVCLWVFVLFGVSLSVISTSMKGLWPASLWWCRLEMPTLLEWLSHIWLTSTLQCEWWNLAWPWSRHDVVSSSFVPILSP